MIDQLNQFATWLFTSITSVWNFVTTNGLIKFFVALYILNYIVDEFRKYAGK